MRSTANGGNPLRRLLTIALTVLVSVLLATTPFLTPVTHAAGGTATWDGSSLEYNSEQFIDAGSAQAKNSASIPAGSEYFTSSGSKDVSDASKTPVDVIYFAPGEDTSKATSATFAEYTVDMTTSPPTYSGEHGKTTITIDKDSQSSATSCGIPSIGWMICGVSNFLAGAMDWIFNVIKGFMEVQPIAIGGSNNAMFTAWNIMRSFANVGFIIGFLLIIYSQLSGFGVSNYGIKKLLPRLIIAAIMVNLSYYLCAIAVDLSNIAGVTLEKLFIGVRDQVFHVDAANITWQQMTTFVLSGGTAGTIGGIALLGATGGSVVSAIYLLLPAIIGLLLAVLLVLVILAARQALITVLIIISPLAFVAYLLPNTEKWFKKWQSTMMTMMVFFPAFSVIYGGAQLAGSIILEHASTIVEVILGMIVQLAPLAISPILFRLSGNIIQGVAKQVQGINKKVQGAGAKWSKERAEMYRQQSLSGMKRDGTPNTRRNFVRNAAIAIDERNRAVADRTKVYQQQADNAYHKSATYETIHEAEHWAHQDKEQIEQNNAAHLDKKIAASPTLYQRQLQTTIATDRAAEAKEALDAAMKEAKSGNVPTHFANNITGFTDSEIGKSIQRDANSLASINQRMAAEKSRNTLADAAITQMVAKAFSAPGRAEVKPGEPGYKEFKQWLAGTGYNDYDTWLQQSKEGQEYATSVRLLQTAGGVMGKVGETRAHNNAVATLRNAKLEAIKSVISASDVPAGGVKQMRQQIQDAIGNGTPEHPVDIVTVRAYIEMLANSSNPGIEKLRDAIGDIEEARASGILTADQLQEIKDHIQNNGTIQGTAEDIGTWGRDKRALADIYNDQSTWTDLSVAAFATQKKSAQHLAIGTGAVSSSRARAILSSEQSANIKESVKKRLRQIAEQYGEGDPRADQPLDPNDVPPIDADLAASEGDSARPEDTGAASPGHPEAGAPMPDA